MPKTPEEQLFDSLVSKIIWPHFKTRGYKKSGNNFRYYHQTGWGKIVNFQKSIYYNKRHIKFTINSGLYLAEAEQFHCNLQSGEKFSESMCLVRERVGWLSDAKTDLWFDLHEQTDIESLYQTVDSYFKNYIIPYVDRIKSRDDILQILVGGHRSHYPIAQIQTLYHNGYREFAKQQFEEALKTSDNPYYLDALKELQKAFK